MKQKIWCLVNKKTLKIVDIEMGWYKSVGFSTEDYLLRATGGGIREDEEIREIELEVK